MAGTALAVAVLVSFVVVVVVSLSSTTGVGLILDKLTSEVGLFVSLEFLLHLAWDPSSARVCAIGSNLSATGFRFCFGLGGDHSALPAPDAIAVVGEAPGDCTLSVSRIHNTGYELVIGLPNSLVTIGLVRLNSGAGLVGVLTEILGIPGGVTTDSTAR